MKAFGIIFCTIFFFACAKKEKIEFTISEPNIAIHESTGLIQGTGMEMVIANCTSCHSAKIITQNRASREGWEGTIRWMQASQNLWPLGENETVILDYLSKNYAPQNVGRRKNLENTEWYMLSAD